MRACAIIALFVSFSAQAGVHVLRFRAGNPDAPIDSAGFFIILDSPALNGKPTLKPIITQYAAPPGLVNVPHPTGVLYVPAVPPAPASAGRWGILLDEPGAMPAGAIFNVLVTSTAKKVDATPLNSLDNMTAIPTAKGKPSAILLFTHMWNPYPRLGGNLLRGVDAPNQGLSYPASTSPKSPLLNKWFIFNQNSSLPAPAARYFIVDTATIPAALGAVRLVHTSTVANTSFDRTAIDEPGALTTADTNVVFVAPLGSDDNRSVGVFHDGSKWTIFNEGGATMSVGRKFNVLMFPKMIP